MHKWNSNGFSLAVKTFAAKNITSLNGGHSAFGVGHQDTSTDDLPLKPNWEKKKEIPINLCKRLCQETEVLETEEICQGFSQLTDWQQQTENDAVLEEENSI